MLRVKQFSSDTDAVAAGAAAGAAATVATTVKTVVKTRAAAPAATASVSEEKIVWPWAKDLFTKTEVNFV